MKKSGIATRIMCIAALILASCGGSGEAPIRDVPRDIEQQAAAPEPRAPAVPAAAKPAAQPAAMAKPPAVAPEEEAAAVPAAADDPTTKSCLDLVAATRFAEALPACEQALRAQPGSEPLQAALGTIKSKLAESAAAQAVEKGKGAMGAVAGVAGAEATADAGGQLEKGEAAAAPDKALQMAGDTAGKVMDKAAAAAAAPGSAMQKATGAAAAVSAVAGEKAAAAAAGPVEALKKVEEVAAASAPTLNETTRAMVVAEEPAAAAAKPGESVVRFDNDKLGEHGPVEFSHPKHKEAFGQPKLDCKPCHMQPPPLFKMKKRAAGEVRYAMEDMNQGKACGKCHDGKTSINDKIAFSVTSEDDCGKCHKK